MAKSKIFSKDAVEPEEPKEYRKETLSHGERLRVAIALMEDRMNAMLGKNHEWTSYIEDIKRLAQETK